MESPKTRVSDRPGSRLSFSQTRGVADGTPTGDQLSTRAPAASTRACSAGSAGEWSDVSGTARRWPARSAVARTTRESPTLAQMRAVRDTASIVAQAPVTVRSEGNESKSCSARAHALRRATGAGELCVVSAVSKCVARAYARNEARR